MNKKAISKSVNWALLALSGASLPFAFAPFEIWPIALLATTVFALIFFRHVAAGHNTKSSVLLAFIFGLGLFGHGASWVYVSIHDFGFTGVPLAIALTCIFVAFLAFVFSLPFYVLARLLNTAKQSALCNSLIYALAFASIWVLGEWLRSWLFTGFPWLFVGYAFIDSPLAAWAPLGGVFLLSFLSVFSGLVIVSIASSLVKKLRVNVFATHAHQDTRLLFIGVPIFLGVWGIPFFLEKIEWTTANDQPQSISLLQPNVELIRKWDPYFFPGILQELDQAADAHWRADIQLWPEAAIPSVYHDIQSYIDDVNTRALATQTNVISGVLYDNLEPYEIYNSIIGIGQASGVYYKQKLVPFGEYVPLEKYLRGLIAFFDLPNSVIKRGPYRPQALSAQTSRGQHYGVAPFICYEVVYPDFVAANARDAELLVTISNDAWFGNSIGPHQHFEMVRMRALENQKYFARATNTGISAIIDHRGKAAVKGEQFTREVIQGHVELRTGLTPFARVGSWPIIIFCFGALSFMFIAAARRKAAEDLQG